jgi:hypothetical protein
LVRHAVTIGLARWCNKRDNQNELMNSIEQSRFAFSELSGVVAVASHRSFRRAAAELGVSDAGALLAGRPRGARRGDDVTMQDAALARQLKDRLRAIVRERILRHSAVSRRATD